MAQGKGGGIKVVIHLGGDEDGKKPQSFRDEIVDDESLNDFAKEQLVSKIDAGGSIQEVAMTHNELKRSLSPGPLMKRRPLRFMGL